MPPLLASVVTILIVTVLGWWLRRSGQVNQDQWHGFEHISYQVFFPAIIIHALAKADLGSVPALAFGATFLAAVTLTGLLLLALHPLLSRRFGISDPSFSSVFQGAIRWNTFMAVGLADRLFGPRGLTLVAVAIAAIIPLMNITTVLMLRRFGKGENGRLSVMSLLKNPFVWSSLVGLTINFGGIPVPAPLLAAADMCGKASLPAALLMVGSGLNLADLGRPNLPLLLSSASKLILLPLIAAGLARLTGIAGADLGVLLLCATVPTAGAAYIMARQMGGDARLMAAIITFETVTCILTIPVFQMMFGP